MTTNHPAVPDDEYRGMTPNERLALYQDHPKALIEDLEFLFTKRMSPPFIEIHQMMARRIAELCPDKDLLFSKVSRAIIDAAKIHHARKG